MVFQITKQDSNRQTKSEIQTHKKMSKMPERLSMEKEMGQRLEKSNLLF